MILTCSFGCDKTNDTTGNNQQNNDDYIPQTVAVKSVGLSKSEITMFMGEKVEIEAEVLPTNATNKVLTWTSTNSAVAEYDNGKIVALGIGTCMIKASSNNGKVASCIVNVEKVPVLAEEVSFPGLTLCMGIGDTAPLQLTISPQIIDDYSGSVTSTNPEVATATYSQDENLSIDIQGLSEGETDITVTLAGGKSATLKVTIIDADKLVKINLPTLPITVSEIQHEKIWNKYYKKSSVRIESIEMEKKVVDGGKTIKVTLTINGTKTFDEDGYSGETHIGYKLSLYKENGVFCESTTLGKYSVSVGEKFTNTFTFGATIDENNPTREFSIEFSNYTY